MKPDISKIDEALIKIEPLLDITRGGNLFSDSERQAFKIALSILQHVKLHGLGLTEEQILEVIDDNTHLDESKDSGEIIEYFDKKRIAKALYERQAL